MKLQGQAIRPTWLGLVCASLVAGCTDAAEVPTAVDRAPGEPSFHLARFVVPRFEGSASVLVATLLGTPERQYPEKPVFIDQDSPKPQQDEYTELSVPVGSVGTLNLLRAGAEFENKQVIPGSDIRIATSLAQITCDFEDH